jgi:hypothetical protein
MALSSSLFEKVKLFSAENKNKCCQTADKNRAKVFILWLQQNRNIVGTGNMALVSSLFEKVKLFGGRKQTLQCCQTPDKNSARIYCVAASKSKYIMGPGNMALFWRQKTKTRVAKPLTRIGPRFLFGGCSKIEISSSDRIKRTRGQIVKRPSPIVDGVSFWGFTNDITLI